MKQAGNISNQKKLVVATSNEGKFREIMEVLEGIPFEVSSSRDLDLDSDVVEDGKTYEDNALIKVRHYAAQTGLLTLAEDSGIVVDALAGQLGVKTRRWGAGADASDEEWIEHFLKVLRDVPSEKRTARFICCAALRDESGVEKIFTETIEGVITAELRAAIPKGLPISACFIPAGTDKVYAAMTPEEKSRKSHRGKAVHAVRDVLMGMAVVA